MNNVTAESSSDNPQTPAAGDGSSANSAPAPTATPESVDGSQAGQFVVEQLNDAHKKSVARLQALRLAIWLCGLLITLVFCGTLLYYAFRK